MHPHAILGIDAFHWVLLFIVPATLVYLGREIKRAGFTYTRFLVLQLGLMSLCLLGAKVFSLWLRDWQWHGPDYELFGGWKYPGAIVALLLFGPPLMWKLLPGYSVWRFCDKLVIAMAFSLAFFRISCVLNGCCTGPVCDGHFCLTYAQGSAAWYEHMQQRLLTDPTGRSLGVVPLHLYFMAASLLVGAFLLWFESRKRYDGQLVLLYLLLHEGSKAILETWRVPYAQNLQVVSAVLAVAAAALLLWQWRRRRGVPVSQVFRQ
jgi:prolipoprotein diacylglyceryltransferase